MAVEVVAVGYQSGVSYTLDHDNTAGTLGFTGTGSLPKGRTMTVNATAAVGVSTFSSGVQNTSGHLNGVRLVLLTNAALVGVTLIATAGNAFACSVDVI